MSPRRFALSGCVVLAVFLAVGCTQQETSPPTTTTEPTTTTSTTAPTTTIPATTTTIATGRSVVFHHLPTTDDPTIDDVVALTFDAGSDLGYTDLVLDTLARHGVPASFGITGAFAEAHPDHIRRMVTDGHVVMNHSHSHRSFTGVSSADVLLSTAERQADLRARGYSFATVAALVS